MDRLKEIFRKVWFWAGYAICRHKWETEPVERYGFQSIECRKNPNHLKVFLDIGFISGPIVHRFYAIDRVQWDREEAEWQKELDGSH